jgi:hypothetical protein
MSVSFLVLPDERCHARECDSVDCMSALDDGCKVRDRAFKICGIDASSFKREQDP